MSMKVFYILIVATGLRPRLISQFRIVFVVVLHFLHTRI